MIRNDRSASPSGDALSTRNTRSLIGSSPANSLPRLADRDVEWAAVSRATGGRPVPRQLGYLGCTCSTSSRSRQCRP